MVLMPGMAVAWRPGETGGWFAGLGSVDRGRLWYFLASSKAILLLTVDKAANFIAVAFAIMSLCDWDCWRLKFGTIGVFDMEAQLWLPRLYGDRSGRSWAGAVKVVLCMLSGWDARGRGERRPADGGGWENCPMGCGADLSEDFVPGA